MKYFDCTDKDKWPRILGLTASIVNGKVKPYKIESEIQQLERVLRAACETSSDDNVKKFATKPTELPITYNDGQQGNADLLMKVLEPWQDFLLDYRSKSEVYKDAKSIVKECIDTTVALGLSASNRVAEFFLKDIGRSFVCFSYCCWFLILIFIPFSVQRKTKKQRC